MLISSYLQHNAIWWIYSYSNSGRKNCLLSGGNLERDQSHEGGASGCLRGKGEDRMEGGQEEVRGRQKWKSIHDTEDTGDLISEIRENSFIRTAKYSVFQFRKRRAANDVMSFF